APPCCDFWGNVCSRQRIIKVPSRWFEILPLIHDEKDVRVHKRGALKDYHPSFDLLSLVGIGEGSPEACRDGETEADHRYYEMSTYMFVSHGLSPYWERAALQITYSN
ncbi:MAG: hypothetical protein K6U00_00415, partial [Armatimonadetes bacterium]|nr:hypothetical protein [Armatimonadota bacterium]